MECGICEGHGWIFVGENKEDCSACDGVGRICNSCEGMLIDSELDNDICEDCLSFQNQKAEDVKHPDEENPNGR